MPMTNETFTDCLKKLNEDAEAILVAKGPDYAGHGEDNRLANFETIAELLKGAPVDALTVAAVYWLKHVFAICTYVRTRREGSEPMPGRWQDERNYNALTFACYEDLPRHRVGVIVGQAVDKVPFGQQGIVVPD